MLHGSLQVFSQTKAWGKLSTDKQTFFVFLHGIPFADRDSSRLVVKEHRNLTALVGHYTCECSRQNYIAIGVGVIKYRGTFKRSFAAVADEFDFGLVESQRLLNIRHHSPHKN